MSVLIKDYYGFKKVELKECPFCGSSELIIVRQSNPDEDTIDDYSYLFNVKCCNCFSQGAKKYMEQYAIEAWNRRAEQTDTKPIKTGEWLEDEYAYFRCSECGYEQDQPETVIPYCPGCGAHMEDESEVTED